MNIDSLSSLVTQWPTDWIILVALAVFVAFDALRAGSNRAATLALAAPLSVVAFNELSQTAFISTFLAQFSAPLAQAVLFGILIIIFFLFIRRIVGLWGDTSEGPLQALIAGVACAGIVATVWLQVPALDSLWHFGPQVHLVFGEAYRLGWLLAGTAALAYVRS